MHYMHDLKDLLCAELEDFAEKGKKSGKMSMGDLETVHKLTDTVNQNSTLKAIRYSEGEGDTSYDDGMHREGYARRYRWDAIPEVCTVAVCVAVIAVTLLYDGADEEMMEEACRKRKALRRCMDALKRA